MQFYFLITIEKLEGNKLFKLNNFLFFVFFKREFLGSNYDALLKTLIRKMTSDLQISCAFIISSVIIQLLWIQFVRFRIRSLLRFRNRSDFEIEKFYQQ